MSLDSCKITEVELKRLSSNRASLSYRDFTKTGLTGSMHYATNSPMMRFDTFRPNLALSTFALILSSSYLSNYAIKSFSIWKRIKYSRLSVFPADGSSYYPRRQL